MREFLTRQFEYSRDLFLAKLNRIDDEDVNLLQLIWPTPEFEEAGEKKRAKPRNHDLIEMGRNAAHDDGIPAPTDEACMRYGLYEVARTSAENRPDEEIPRLIRRALFKVETSEYDRRLSPEILEYAYERFCMFAEDHLDDSTEEFNNWFFRNEMLAEMAKKTRAPGGRFDPKILKAALLYWGWTAHEYVAQSLGLQMIAFRNSLKIPLDERERQVFDQMHLPQPHLGGLTLLLLAERFPFAEVAIKRLVENPGDRQTISVFHRMLENYAILAGARREADSRSKRGPKMGEHGAVLSFDEERDSPRGEPSSNPGNTALDPELAARVARDEGLSCDCSSTGEADWGGLLMSENDNTYEIGVVCYTCNYNKILEIFKFRFNQLADSNNT
jgi:hypothetical protein